MIILSFPDKPESGVISFLFLWKGASFYLRHVITVLLVIV